MASKSIGSYHCEVCQKETRHMKLDFADVMREIADPAAEKRGAGTMSALRVKSFLGSLASMGKRDAYKCIRCRSYLIPHLGKNHCYAIDNDFQPWYVVQRNPKMLKEVREKYNPNL